MRWSSPPAAAFALLLAGFPRAVPGLIGGGGRSRLAAWLFGAGAVPAWLANTLASVLRGGGRHALASRVLSLAYGGLFTPERQSAVAH